MFGKSNTVIRQMGNAKMGYQVNVEIPILIPTGQVNVEITILIPTGQVNAMFPILIPRAPLYISLVKGIIIYGQLTPCGSAIRLHISVPK